jgi:serine/threonine-protein kinase
MNRIGRYKISGLLGRGGMSKVYKVQLPVVEKIVALKLLDPDPLLVDLIGMNKIRDLFISEAKKLAELRHPNIVEIWNFDEADGRPFYLMDYYFKNLAVMIGETRWTDRPSRIIRLDKAIEIVRQILSGLACLHHAGIIHRDIKPFNILLTDLDTVKICDFGLSKLRGEKVSVPSNLNVGSPWYAPPEQEADPNLVDSSADLYATGVTLYRMLTGKLPDESPEQPSQNNPDLDEAWDNFLLKSIAHKPAERFKRATDMLNELESLETAWQQRQNLICSIPESPIVDQTKPEAIRLRKDPVKIAPQEARRSFRLDQLWRPHQYIRNVFKTENHDLISDAITGLMWQKTGSKYPLTWQQARKYVDNLNQREYAGYNSWRLPTVDELMSLLADTPHGEDYCIAPVFDPTQQTIWSCDRRSFTAAWFVSVHMGFVWWQDFSAYFYVRAVSDNESD